MLVQPFVLFTCFLTFSLLELLKLLFDRKYLLLLFFRLRCFVYFLGFFSFFWLLKRRLN